MLHNDLSDLTQSIVLGKDLPPALQVFCPKYPTAVALSVYRNNYFGNLHDALAYAYPVIEQLVGQEFFLHLTRKYIARHHSASGDLHQYGADMAAFVAQFEPAQGLTYLPDMAKLEWACHRAYFAEDVVPLDLKRLSTISPETYPNLLLHLNPACHVVYSSHPITAIWNAHQPDAGSDFDIDWNASSGNALVHRREHTVLVSELAAADVLWLQNIAAGATVGESTAVTQNQHPDFNLVVTLLRLVELELLTDFSVEAAP